jgi:hypothetical protein
MQFILDLIYSSQPLAVLCELYSVMLLEVLLHRLHTLHHRYEHPSLHMAISTPIKPRSSSPKTSSTQFRGGSQDIVPTHRWGKHRHRYASDKPHDYTAH